MDKQNSSHIGELYQPEGCNLVIRADITLWHAKFVINHDLTSQRFYLLQSLAPADVISRLRITIIEPVK